MYDIFFFECYVTVNIIFIKIVELFWKIFIILNDKSRNMFNIIYKMLNKECDYHCEKEKHKA